jgi:hypothetical protein
MVVGHVPFTGLQVWLTQWQLLEQPFPNAFDTHSTKTNGYAMYIDSSKKYTLIDWVRFGFLYGA